MPKSIYRGNLEAVKELVEKRGRIVEEIWKLTETKDKQPAAEPQLNAILNKLKKKKEKDEKAAAAAELKKEREEEAQQKKKEKDEEEEGMAVEEKKVVKGEGKAGKDAIRVARSILAGAPLASANCCRIEAEMKSVPLAAGLV